MKKPTAAIFDLDGLMLDTERPFLNSLFQKSRERGYDVPFDLLLKTIGIDCRATEKLMQNTLGQDFPYRELRAEVYALQKKEVEKRGISHRPGLLSLLDALDAKKIPAAVATSTDRERAAWKLTYGGIASRFDIIVCGDEIEHGKPAPDIFLCAAKKIGYSPEECAGFEDSPAGLRALAAAGIRSIFIKDMVEPDEEILTTVWKRCLNLSEAIDLF
jgi:HAD superfamily hydrolase (TIGR01509 family)